MAPARLLARVLRPATLTRSVQSSALGGARQLPAALCGAGLAQHAAAPPLAPRRGFAHAPLGGKNIFQARASAEVVEAAAAAATSSSSGAPGAGGQENPYAGVVLPTSDESEQLLRIRHSVSGRAAAQAGRWQGPA